MEAGIGRATEEEEGINVEFARNCVKDPDLILTSDSELVQAKKKYSKRQLGLW